MSAVGDVRTWEETEDPFLKATAFFPAASGTLAVEPSTAFEDVERLLVRQPGWKPISAGPLLGPMRMAKTREESAAVRPSIEITVARFRKAFGALKPRA